MKKTLIAFAALSAIAGVAQAQSTVTIYGLLDANLQSLKTNVGGGNGIQSLTQTRQDSGALNGSRWGIRVKEDLGGGLAAVGNLESGINLDTGASGQGGVLFGRRANVGLSGGFGTVTIGRNSSSYDDVSADHAMMAQTIFDPSNVNNGNSAAAAGALAGAANAYSLTPTLAAGRGLAAAAVPFLNRNTTWVGYNTRFNNSIKYISPNFSGFSGSLMYAFNEDKTNSVSASKTVSANLKFANGPLVVSGGYQSEGITAFAGSGSKPVLENTLVSVSYDLGVAKIGAGYNRAKYKDISATTGFDAQKEFNLSVAVPLGAATISAGYAQSKGDTFGKSTGYGIQALYSLSKRTTLYTGLQSTKTFDNLASAAVLAAPGSSVGRVQTFGVGVRHTF